MRDKIDDIVKCRRGSENLYGVKKEILMYFHEHKNWQKEYFSVQDNELYLNVFGDKNEIRDSALSLGRVAFNIIFGEKEKRGLIATMDIEYDEARKVVKKVYGICPLIKIRRTPKHGGFFLEPTVDQLDINYQKKLRQARRHWNTSKNNYKKVIKGCELEQTVQEAIAGVDEE